MMHTFSTHLFFDVLWELCVTLTHEIVMSVSMLMITMMMIKVSILVHLEDLFYNLIRGKFIWFNFWSLKHFLIISFLFGFVIVIALKIFLIKFLQSPNRTVVDKGKYEFIKANRRGKKIEVAFCTNSCQNSIIQANFTKFFRCLFFTKRKP